MKHSTVFITGLFLALGSLFVGLQIGKAQLKQTTPAGTIQAIAPEVDDKPDSSLQTQSIALLQQQIITLQKQLADKDELIASMQSSMGLLEQQVEIAVEENQQFSERDVSAQSPFKDEPYTLSIDNIKQWTPEPFANVIASQSGDIVKAYEKHHLSERNEDWATTEEEQILAAINQHPLSGDIQIDSISCKQNTCEIRAFELAPQAWMEVSNGFRNLNENRSTSSWSYLAGSEQGTLIYMLTEYKAKDAQDSSEDGE
ncbi:hypothetical protein EXU30_13545 [Shewanella maritima]|uniref:Uncharacterized protein n=1 Tax=Shewanella maritima TaxID=2520507 RepID=A0A411PJD8_9GAMM|nr:hypothetical protein [Shewanella maritima]QBF83604.1 hypothetical protein EXU30_13545 [Shewanella maritima]